MVSPKISLKKLDLLINTFIFVLIETVASRLVLKDRHGIQRLAHSKEPCGELSVLLLTYSSRHLIISGIIFRGQTF